MSAKKKPIKVHPLSPPTNGHLSLLPAAILTLAATLSPEDKEVLAYLISFSSSHQKPYSTIEGAADHSPGRFDCSCFKCYTRFWARWDSSPNQEVIHKIIEAYEEGLLLKRKSSSKVKKRRKNNSKVCDDAVKVDGGDGGGQAAADGSGDRGGEFGSSAEKGSVRKIVSFIGERIWGVWNKV